MPRNQKFSTGQVTEVYTTVGKSQTKGLLGLSTGKNGQIDFWPILGYPLGVVLNRCPALNG